MSSAHGLPFRIVLALVAAALMIGSIGAPTAAGQISYTPLPPDAFYFGQFLIDVDQNGTTDLTLSTDPDLAVIIPASGVELVTYSLLTGVTWAHPAGTSIGGDVQSLANVPADAGTPAWGGTGPLLILQQFFYAGQSGARFVPFRVSTPQGWRYGWLGVNLNFFTLAIGAAVQTTPELAILAGDTGQPFCQPSVIDQFGGGSALRGTSVVFNFSTWAGAGQVSYQWFRGEQPIAGATSESYDIPAVALADEGSYTCVASTPCGTTSGTFTLDILCALPQSSFPPFSRTPGESVRFEAGWLGDQPTNLRWFKGETPVENSARISGATTATLDIADIRVEDAGVYVLRGDTECGPVTNSQFTLNVNCLPALTISGRRSLRPGDTLTLVGNLPASSTGMQWTRDGVPLADSPGVSGSTTPTLLITAATFNDTGRYALSGTNPCGAALAATVDVRVEPNCNPIQAPGNQAATLDGVSAYITVVPEYIFRPFESFTLEAWVKLRRPLAGSRLLDAYNGCGSDNVSFSLVDGPAGTPSTRVSRPDSPVDSPVFAGVPLNGQWQHIAWVLDRQSSSNFIYLNGDLIGVGSSQSPIPNGRSFITIGRADCAGNVLADVLIDEMRFWAVARSPEQIRAAMRSTIDPNTTGLRAYWRFDVIEPNAGFRFTPNIAPDPAYDAVLWNTADLVPVVPCCPADYNGSATLTVQDIFDFIADFFAGRLRADTNRDGTISVQDIFDFLAAYFAGCP